MHLLLRVGQLNGKKLVSLQLSNHWYHQPLDFKLVKQLKEAVMQYGPQVAFTISLVESIAGMNLIPEDWGNLARAALSRGQYLVWKTAWQEQSQDVAWHNATAGNPQWNLDMLVGMGPYVGRNEQLQYNPAVYLQIAASATKVWKTLQGSGDLQAQLSKVIQGSNEAYADFVARLMQTAGRIFGDADTAMPLIKQLAYEQANKWCKEAIRPWKAKDLSTYIKVCRDINNSVIQGQVLASAITQGFQSIQGPQCRNNKGGTERVVINVEPKGISSRSALETRAQTK